MLTKRQQEALISIQDRGHMWPSCLFSGLLGTTVGADYFAYMSAYALMHCGLAAFDGSLIRLTPTGEKLAAILAKLPAPLTKRQWEVLLRFRDVGSDSNSICASSFRSGLSGNRWFVPSTPGEWSNDTAPRSTNERTIRTLCDYGLLGFEYMEISATPYAHLSPLGHELVNLLPATVRR